MIDPITTTLAYDRQHELLQQAETDRLVHAARPQGDRRPRKRFGTFVSRLFTTSAVNRPAEDVEPAQEDAPSAA
jgi:hypothetical protein